MATYTLPGNPGFFRVIIGMTGNYIVTNDRTGKNQVLIPCASRREADELCERLNRGDHNGAIHH